MLNDKRAFDALLGEIRPEDSRGKPDDSTIERLSRDFIRRSLVVGKKPVCREVK